MRLTHREFERILNIVIDLSTEKNRKHLLSSILKSCMKITHCDASRLYLYEDDVLTVRGMRFFSKVIDRVDVGEMVSKCLSVPLSATSVCAYAARNSKIVNIANVYEDNKYDCLKIMQFDSMISYRTESLLVIPIENSENDLIGVMELINAQDQEGEIIPFDEQYHIIIRSLGSLAAIELSNISYITEIKEQQHSFVEAFSTAIDERTPYNGMHTRKVAQYSEMIANAINKRYEVGESKEYFDEERKEKLFLAAVVHDIGKLVIPLSVMNRATRLDKDILRIEERFRLIRCYYEIDMLRGRITDDEYHEIMAEMDADMEFIKKIDTMGYLDDDNYEKVRMLANKQHIKRDGTVTPYITAKEAECLSIRKGTLTDEARSQMESHVIVTKKILSKVHFSKKYERVPIWAASHHEFLDGSGYPDHLTADQLELESRILTVSDIYDALTARDRPYKRAMKRHQAIEVLREMAGEGKIDGQLVELLAEELDIK